MTAFAIALFVGAWLTARIALPVIERAAHATGFLDRADARKDHGGAVAYGGGVALLAATGLPALAGMLVASFDGAAWLPPAIAVHLPGIRTTIPRLLAILIGAAAMLALGYADDRRRIGAWPRLLAEATAALALAALGTRITLFMPWPAVHIVLTVVFIVFATNAANFIDNMNGLLTGVALIEAAAFLAIAIDGGQWFLAAILLCVCGGLCAFLPWNFPDARMFLGDAGSLLLGFLLAALTVAMHFESGHVSVRPFVVPLLVLAVPLTDGAVVVLSRLRRGVHPFTAGHDHLSHRLLALGMERNHAVLVLWGCAALGAVIALVIAGVTLVTATATLGVALFVLSMRARVA